uniref:Late blight resistance protein, putative n=1 Tax=Solanum demissum TaxID=50514 RepID=Q0KIQ4_SOLDE|nr:Late blight resistance protein, putative [Solanum demissum]
MIGFKTIQQIKTSQQDGCWDRPHNILTKQKLETQNIGVLRKVRRLTTDSRVLSWINDEQGVDPGYLCLHHNKMQANWHQYMECTSMRAGPLNNNSSLKGVQRKHTLALLNS